MFEELSDEKIALLKQERDKEWIKWGEEECDCPDNSLAQYRRNKPIRKRRTCWKCWQERKAEVSNGN